ncbi:unnamed protein product, partial [Lymnaea stagnalis]
NHSSQTNLRNGESSCTPQSSVIFSIRDLITKDDTSHQLKFNGNHASHTARLNPAVETHSRPCVDSPNQSIRQKHYTDNSQLHQPSQIICNYDTSNYDKSDKHESNFPCCLSHSNTLITENSESSPKLTNGKSNFRSRQRLSFPGSLPVKLMLVSDRLVRSFLNSRGEHSRVRSCQSLPDLAFTQQRTTERPPSKVSEYLDVHLAQSVPICGPGNTKMTGRCVNNKRMKQDEKSEPTPHASVSAASMDTKCRRLEASHVHQV